MAHAPETRPTRSPRIGSRTAGSLGRLGSGVLLGCLLAALSSPIASAEPTQVPAETAGASAEAAGAAASTPETPVPADPGQEPEQAPAPAPAAIRREIVLELGRREISLHENGQVVRRWPVAIGDPSTPTPLGTFSVQNKVVNPRYQSTKSGKINNTVGAQGPLGDRWIGFKQSGANQYGIHGTPSAWAWTVTSRAAVSNGCVRMLTPHVRELFEKVEIGTPVIVKR